MATDSGYVGSSTGLKNRNSYIQWTPQHSLSLNDSYISKSMSKHLHSTTRRIFIGPTPANWSYKKSSFWFSKSDHATHHKGPNRQRTFRAEPEVKGPTNMSSLDFYDTSDNQNSVSRITDAPLVSEPEEILIDHNDSGSLFSNEIFYTPNEELRSYPNTPQHLHFMQKDSEYFSTNYMLNALKQKSPITTTSNRDFSDEIISSSESLHPNHVHNSNNETNNASENDVENVRPSNVDIRSADNVNSTNLINLEAKSPIYEPGTIIKEDRMLVRVERLNHHETLKRYGGPLLRNRTHRKNLTHSLGWREYIVKLRPGIIELYEDDKTRFAKMRFNKTIRLILFSAVDYTISLKQKSKSKTKIFLINPKTVEQSIEWYRLLHATLGEPSVKPMPSSCEVYVPDLDVHVKIPLENYQAYQITAEEVTRLVLDELSGEPEWEDILNEWLKSCDLRLCWKRYDQLEWIVWEKNEEGKVRNDLLACPQFIEGTHQLQLRPTEHYPTSVYLSDGTKLIEPPPIEGYLVRVTSNKGKWKPKRLYFTSHDYYLFFLKPFETSPPPQPASSLSNDEGSQHVQPLIYAVAPQSQEQCVQTGAFMKADIKRRIKQIKNAVAFINLLEVEEVKSEEAYGVTEMENHGCPFQLVLNNGMVVVLQAYSRQTMLEWVSRLKELIKYWKARKMSDIQVRINMVKMSETNDYEDDDNSSQNEIHSHWNNFQTYINPTIWHWCILNGCRGITKGGLLYRKSHRYGTFRNYHYILTGGNLLCFHLYTRNLINGVTKRQCYHKRCGNINLADCYVYSGRITENDLLYSSTSKFSAKSSGIHKLPRIYPDGMSCFDNAVECTFVIWQAERSFYFGKEKKEKGNVIRLKKKTMLNNPGKIWVFRTRSKIEREEWVWAINVEIERACKIAEMKQ
ncbi:hypothetical protein RclHR1_11830006 [Rhizophagus clarus]|uniref:PH domain protein n=1 Tax=Rhizophagus clarus TaxID=94130 RepID=A0A2Z6Q6W0_9GLOM|nr:hypothetical protein RclHR1_11830006 [Rhizophagus clarus]GES90080.1 PH domain protein [Rhizophagus clarus]